MCLRTSTVLSVLLLLVACGGGGGGGESSARVTADRQEVSTASQAFATEPSPPSVVNLRLDRLPGDGVAALIEQTSIGINSVQVIETGTLTAQVVVNWKAPPGLPLGTYTDNIRILICYDEACSRQLDGSPITLTAYHSIEQSDSSDPANAYTVRGANVTASELAWDPISQRIYAAVPSEQSVVVIDPRSGRVEGRIGSLGQADAIAVSDDGQYVYTNALTDFVYRLRLPSLVREESIFYNGAVTDVDVAPGRPRTIAATFASSGGNFISVYDAEGFLGIYGLTPRPAALVWDPNGVTLYSKAAGGTALLRKDIVRPRVDGVMNVFPDAFARAGGELNYSGGRIVDDFGTFVDAATGTRTGTLVLPGDLSQIVKVVPDAALNRVFSASELLSERRLTSFDWSTLTRRVTLELTGLRNSAGAPSNTPTTDLIRWGDDGLALATSDRVLLITGTFVAP